MTMAGGRQRPTTLEFLGTGTSAGVPVPGCRCGVCRSADPHDKRLRSSVLIRRGARNVIIDTGPEFRIQCLRAGVPHLDSVLLTHDHADHLNGFDDVRAFSHFKRKALPVWGASGVLASIRKRFDYIWNATQRGGGLPDVDLRTIDGSFDVIGVKVIPIPVKHGKLDILGFRIGDLAYMTDISALPETSFPLLENLATMVVSCVRCRRHRTHLSMIGATRLHERVRPRRTLVTHLPHHFTHKELIALLPRGMDPAYDGLRVEIGV